MYPLRYKIMLAAALGITLLPLLYFLSTGLSLFETDPSYLVNLTPYLFVLFAAVIILSPIVFGTNGHWAAFIIAGLSISVLSVITGHYIYNLQSLLLLGVTLVIHFFYAKRVNILEKTIASIERIKESTNVIKSKRSSTDRLNTALSGRLGRYKNLREIGESFSNKLSVDNICKLTVEIAYEIMPYSDAALLFTVNEVEQKLVLRASKKSTELPKIKSKNGDIFDKWVFKERQALSIKNIEEDFRFDYKPLAGERHFKSLISVPLISQSRIAGILRLNGKEKNAYTFDDLRLLDFISDLASSSLNNARLYETTEELSTRDSLTGFYIHRYMKERLFHETERARLNNLELSVIMIDIDHFKDYNDKYGHSAGDKVLLGIADIMKSGIKTEGHTIARYGGEEFVIILPNVSNDKAITIAEKIKQHISAYTFVLRRKETNVTVSAGVASYADNVRNSEELLKRADFFLYKAKKQGRNKVCAA